MILGILVGTLSGGAVAAVASFQPGLLTHDPDLWPLLGQVAPQVFIALVATGIDVCGVATNIAVSGSR